MIGARLSLFTVKEQEYASFTVSAQTLTWIVYALCIGILLAAAYTLYQKNVPGSIVRRILAAEALSKESAKTAEELALTGWLRMELAHNVTLRRLVHRVQGEEDETRYFIPEEEKYRAELRYEKRGNDLPGFLLTVLLTLGFALLLIQLLPVFLSLADRLLGA